MLQVTVRLKNLFKIKTDNNTIYFFIVLKMKTLKYWQSGSAGHSLCKSESI